MKIEKLIPETKDYIWGGTQLLKIGKGTGKQIVAESWELSFHNDGLTKIADQRYLKDVVTIEDLGTNCQKFNFFPLMIKLIDAENNLSIQVHPSDDYALKNENSYGKTEVWYITEASEGAGIYLGFKKDITKEQLENSIKNNTLTELLNFFPVKKGESYFVDSGTVHAICKGCTICEIQQNSNITYRLYDYNRRDNLGNPRELHIEKAKLVTNLNQLKLKKFDNNIIATCEYFTVEKHEISGYKSFNSDKSSFIAITIVDGEGLIDSQKANLYDTFFVPANYGEFKIRGNLTILLTKV